MQTYTLRGLPEGIVGKGSVMASSIDDLMAQYPALAAIRGKLNIRGRIISGFAACDG